MAADCDVTSQSMLASLNEDALEEVFMRCAPADLLALRGTCKYVARFLENSEEVWLAKLRDNFGLDLKALAASNDAVFFRLARQVCEASREQQLRFQGVFVNGGVDEDAMHYWVENLWKYNNAPYCSNCSYNADAIALLLDGEVPREAEFARVRQYLIKRCRYAAALILNVQMPGHGRDPDDLMHILEDWSDVQLEDFFKDLVHAMQAEHALGRLLVFDIPHDRLTAEEERIQGVYGWLINRPKMMRAAMIKPPGEGNTMFDTSVMDKLTGGTSKRLAGVVHKVYLSRAGNLTCPVSAGAVVVGTLDHSKVQGWSSEDVMALLQSAAADPRCSSLNSLQTASDVQQASSAGLLPPIVATDETAAGVWHEFSAGPELLTTAQPTAAGAEGTSVHRDAGATASEQPVQPPHAVTSTEAASSSGQAQVSAAGIISWRPLVWFKYHTAEEATSFAQRYRTLIDQHGQHLTVRHHGPAPTRPSHVTAPAGAQMVSGAAQPGDRAAPPEQLQHAQHVQAQVPAVDGLQQAVALGAPLAGQPGDPGIAAGVPVAQALPFQQHGPADGHPAQQVPVGGPLPLQPHVQAGGHGEVQLPPDMDDGAEQEASEEADSESDDGVEEGADGAWPVHWAQHELGADLQQDGAEAAAEQEAGLAPMDEGNSSESDDEDDVLLAEPFEPGNAGPAAGQHGAAAQQQTTGRGSAAERMLRVLSRRNTRMRDRLTIPLTQPVGANIVLVKLIAQENLMEQYGDPHTWPNVDMTVCGLVGRAVELPPYVVLSP